MCSEFGIALITMKQHDETRIIRSDIFTEEESYRTSGIIEAEQSTSQIHSHPISSTMKPNQIL
jgi:hypothetical protein